MKALVGTIMENKVWLITGCSSGFGKAIAKSAIEAGYSVAVTARDVNSLGEFQALGNELVLVTELDVTNQDSVSVAVDKTIARFGRIDVLVNNAGYGYYEIFEELDINEFKKEMDVNLYGAVRTCQAVLSQMRKQRSGHIINISSIGGSVGMAGRSAYCASKFALGGLSECLAKEVRPFGIKVTVLEPGQFRTDFFNKGKTEIKKTDKPDYMQLVNELNQQFAAVNGRQKGSPELAANAIIQLSRSSAPPLRVPLGADAVSWNGDRLKLANEELETWKQWALDTAFDETKSPL
jgi:NAD(P)-dependent dehydrogenase (short-subunit alcohol dehydrogenase family)